MKKILLCILKFILFVLSFIGAVSLMVFYFYFRMTGVMGNKIDEYYCQYDMKSSLPLGKSKQFAEEWQVYCDSASSIGTFMQPQLSTYIFIAKNKSTEISRRELPLGQIVFSAGGSNSTEMSSENENLKIQGFFGRKKYYEYLKEYEGIYISIIDLEEMNNR